jgi:hypothetical protein
MPKSMTNKDRFFVNLKITRAVRKRDRFMKSTSFSDVSLDAMNTEIKRLENSLKEKSNV